MSDHAAFAGLTDAGHARSHNEDALIARPPLFAVADGLGGHKAGEVASEIAVETLARLAPTTPDATALADAVTAANAAIVAAVAEGRGRQGMGTTLTAAVVRGTHAVVAQVGDSRAYLLANGHLSRVTRDHSLVGDMVRAGTLTEEQARNHPQRSVITRALGSRPDVEADTYDISASPGDRLLLCSDGLHGMIVDSEIEEVLLGATDAEDAVRSLVDAALDAGGLDNVTAIVVEFGGTEPSPRATPRARRTIAAVLWTLAALAIVAATAFGLYSYASDRAYLIAEDGRVVVYRGVQGSFAGIQISELESVTDIDTASLPIVTAERLAEGVPADSVAEALELLAEYRALVGTEPTATPQP